MVIGHSLNSPESAGSEFHRPGVAVGDLYAGNELAVGKGDAGVLLRRIDLYGAGADVRAALREIDIAGPILVGNEVITNLVADAKAVAHVFPVGARQQKRGAVFFRPVHQLFRPERPEVNVFDS